MLSIPLLATQVYEDWFALVTFRNVSTDSELDGGTADVVMVVKPTLLVMGDPVVPSSQVIDGTGMPKARQERTASCVWLTTTSDSVAMTAGGSGQIHDHN